MSDCFVLYLLLICMKKKKSGAGKFTNNSIGCSVSEEIFNQALIRQLSAFSLYSVINALYTLMHAKFVSIHPV